MKCDKNYEEYAITINTAQCSTKSDPMHNDTIQIQCNCIVDISLGIIIVRPTDTVNGWALMFVISSLFLRKYYDTYLCSVYLDFLVLCTFTD